MPIILSYTNLKNNQIYINIYHKTSFNLGNKYSNYLRVDVKYKQK